MAEARKSRTEELLVQLKVPRNFKDQSLPKGYFSHSQYGLYKACGAAYEFKHVLGMPEPKSGSMARGSALHKGTETALVAKMNTGNVPGLDQVKAMVGVTFDDEATKVERWEEGSKSTLKQEAISLYEAFHTKALPEIHPVAVEKGFAVKFGGVPMVGWIDLEDEQPAIDTTGMSPEAASLAPKKLVVADTKTTKAKWSDRDVALDTQLTLYAAVEGTPDVRVDQLIPYAKGAAYVPAESTRDKAAIAVLEEDVAEVADLIRGGVFPKAPIDSWKCSEKFCAFWSVCRGRRRS